MPGKGHALEKPTINDAHKAAVQAKLERDKKAAAEARGPFAKQLVAEVELAHLSDARKADAYVAIDEACYALDKGDNPFDLLRQAWRHTSHAVLEAQTETGGHRERCAWRSAGAA
jgi:hypothetical protein